MASYFFYSVLFLLYCFCFSAQAVLERQIPVLDEHTNLNLDQLIKSYFNLCFTQNEIVAFLAVSHGIVISSRQLKRILRRTDLRRIEGEIMLI